MTTDAAALGLEQAYGRFPEARLRRVGVTDAQLDALRTAWEQQPLGWRYQQGLAIAASPDDWIATEVGQWPPPTAIPLAIYVGPYPPADPIDDTLWWSTFSESMSRYDAPTDEWVAESSTAAGSFVPLSVLAVAGGVATLDAEGKLVSAQIPRFVIGETFVVASQPAMLALDAHIGDIAKRSDQGGAVYMLTEADPATLGNWLSIGAASGDVASVNGQVGVVVLGPADVGTDAAGTPRPPTAHAAAHAEGGADPVTPGSIGTDAAGTPRPPTAHKSSHVAGAADALTPSDIGAPTRVNHGSTAGTARPTGVVGPVLWFGTVAPTNAATNDLWFDQTVGVRLWKVYTGSAWISASTSTLPDSSITVDPSGLVVVQGSDTNVHSVIARLDGAVNARISQVRQATDVDYPSVSAATPILAYNSAIDKFQGAALPATLQKQHIAPPDVGVTGTANAQGPTVDIAGSGFSLGVTPAGVHQWVSIGGAIKQTGGVQPSPGTSTLSFVVIRLTETTGGGSVLVALFPFELSQNSVVAGRDTRLFFGQFYLGAIASTRSFLWQAYTLSPGGQTAAATLSGLYVDTYQR